MSRKFEIGQAVILSNPRTKDNKEHHNHRFTIRGYEKGSTWPYALHSPALDEIVYVRPNEITLEDAPVVVENPVADVPVSTEPLREWVAKTPNEVALSNIMVFDEVLVAFKPKGDELIAQLGVTETMEMWDYVRTNFKNANVGNVGVVTRVNTEKGRVKVRFGADGSAWYPAISLIVTKPSGALFRFQASEDEFATLFPTHVIVDEINVEYQFELFETLWAAIKEYRREGYHAPINLQNEWVGHFHHDYLEVGCQNFTYDNIRRLVALIRKVKKVS